MAVRQHIGSRYVPIFGRKGEESILWDNSAPYEPLTVVLYQGNSYTSRQYVPIGVDIHNEEFWANTGNYNAQVEQYRQEVLTFDGRITDNTDAIEAETQARSTAVAALQGSISAEAATRLANDNALQSSISSLDAGLSAETTARQNDVTSLSNNITTVNNKIGQNFTAENTVSAKTDSLQLQINNEASTRAQRDTELADAIAELTPTTLSHIVFIGDSYGTGYQPSGSPLQNNIPVLTNSYLKEHLTLHNYCVNATGFVTMNGNTSFITELNNAIVDAATDHWTNLVKYVVVIGGRNDSSTTTNADTYSAQLFDRIHEAFPTAKAFYAYLWDAYRRPNGIQLQNYRTYVRQATTHNVVTDAMSPSWGLLNTQMFAQSGPLAGDDIHPNQDGANFYAQCLAQLIEGGNACTSPTYVANFGNGVTVRKDGFIAVIEGNAMTGSGTTDVKLATVPACLSFSTLCEFLAESGDSIFWARCDANSDGYSADLKAIGGKKISGGTPAQVSNGFLRTTVHMFS